MNQLYCTTSIKQAEFQSLVSAEQSRMRLPSAVKACFSPRCCPGRRRHASPRFFAASAESRSFECCRSKLSASASLISSSLSARSACTATGPGAGLLLSPPNSTLVNASAVPLLGPPAVASAEAS